MEIIVDYFGMVSGIKAWQQGGYFICKTQQFHNATESHNYGNMAGIHTLRTQSFSIWVFDECHAIHICEQSIV